MTEGYLPVVTNLCGILFLFFVTMYIFKKINHKKTQSNQYIKILNTVSLGTKEKLLLIEINQTLVLLGATANHIETLYVFNKQEQEQEQAQNCEEKEPFLSNFKLKMTRLQEAKSELGI